MKDVIFILVDEKITNGEVFYLCALYRKVVQYSERCFFLSGLAGLNFSLETITSNVNTLCAKEEYFKYTLNFLLQNIHDQFINFIWKAKRGRDEVNR